MSNYDLEEDVLLKYQICLSFIFIITILISISLSYNAMMDFEKKEKFYSDEEEQLILRMNRIVSFLVALGFILINIYDKAIKEKYNLDNDTSSLQILASLFTMISSLIALYVAFNSNGLFTSNENPEI